MSKKQIFIAVLLLAVFALLCWLFMSAAGGSDDVVILKLGHGLDVTHPVHKAMVFMADRVADLYGLSLFEMDVVTHKALYVIDVNPVVSLQGVEDGAIIYDRLLRTRTTRALL